MKSVSEITKKIWSNVRFVSLVTLLYFPFDLITRLNNEFIARNQHHLFYILVLKKTLSFTACLHTVLLL